MDAWGTYQNRIAAHGGSKRNAAYIREVRAIERKLPDNLSYQTVNVYPSDYGFNVDSEASIQHRLSQDMAVINTDNLNEKLVYSMPGADITLGSLIFWMDNYWLVCERDANTTLYTKAKAIQCNHLLKWISPDKEIIEQWCVVEDGTKYLTGEYEDRDFFVTRGDSRISIQLAKNKYTNLLNRESRFLVDDDDAPHKLSYLLTKPLKRGYIYNNAGTFKFVLQEVTATEFDNHELGIADYYRYFPKESSEDGSTENTENIETKTDRKKVWI